MLSLGKVLPACAVAVGVALVTVTSAFTEAPKANDEFFYYEFKATANDNDADDISNWSPITQSDYMNSACEETEKACVLKAASIPSSVPYTQEVGYKNPVEDGVVVLEVKNREEK